MPLGLDLRDQVAVARYLAKWLLILTPVAAAIGSVSALFLWSLQWATETRWEYSWLLFLLPLAGFLSAVLYHRFGRSVEGGNNLLVDEIHAPGGGVPPRIVPLVFGATVIAHLFGASVGREGTAIQMGGGIASAFSRVLRLGPDDLRTLLMAGVAAGFGAVFGTPIAGAIFAMEVLALGRMEYGAIIPVLYASLAADYTASAWNAHHTVYHIAIVGRDGDLPFDALMMARAALAGIAFGLAAVLFAELTHGLARAFRAFVRNPLFRPVIGGAVIIAFVFLLGTRDYLGLGVTSPDAGATTILSSFESGGADPASWWWKIAFTSLALGSGFKGGEVTPLFFIGATLGNRIAALLSAPADLFAGLGFVAVFAGAANTPLACTVMGIELFGADAAPYIAVACFVAYLVSGHSGIYLSQRIGTPKVWSVAVPQEASLRALREGRAPVALPFALRSFRPEAPATLLEGASDLGDTYNIRRQELGLVRIYMPPREKAPRSGFMASWRTRPLYRVIIDAAKQAGLMNAVAHPTQYGFSGSQAIQARGVTAEVPNDALMLCVELIAPSHELERFCEQHGTLLAGKIIVHKVVEHWHIDHGAVVVDAVASEDDVTGELHAVP